jgi:tRNA(Glu) U13 pseudouridine synthase TruD
MAVTPQNITIAHDRQEATLALAFSLPVGAYATVLLGQWFDLQDLSLASAS